MQGKVFKIDPDEAKMWIIHVVHTLEIMNVQDLSQRRQTLGKVIDTTLKVLDVNCSVATMANMKEVSCQTDTEIAATTMTATAEEEQSPVKNQMHINFDKFLHECAVIEDDCEVSSADITSAYRIWARKADKETYHGLLNYLKVKFKYCRLTVQTEAQIVMGYYGVALKRRDYTSPFAPTKIEQFLHQHCVFAYSGKILRKDILIEYRKWFTAT